jgi:hypothetical protein
VQSGRSLLESPTIFRAEGFRSCFFSREERRIHVHAQSAKGEAKSWLEPEIELAVSCNLKSKDLSRIRGLIEEREDETRSAWHEHFER